MLRPILEPAGRASPSLGRAPLSLALLFSSALVACGDHGTAPTPPAPRIELPKEAIEADVGGEVSLRVRVVSPDGTGLGGVRAVWRVAAGGGELRAAEGETDQSGYIHADWTLGPIAGEQSVVVRAGEPAVEATITATARPGPLASLRLPKDTLLFTAFRQVRTLKARGEDRFGNAIEELSLEWESLDPAIVSVDAAGRATAHKGGSTRVAARTGAFADTARVAVDPRGAITITFDDGFASTYGIAYPVLKAHGMRGNVGVVSGYVDGKYPDYLTLAQLRELSDAGWSMVSHSVSHPELNKVSGDQLRKEVVESKRWLEQNKFRGSSVFIVPYHAWGEREQALIREHYQAARGYGVKQFWPDSIVPWKPSDPYALTSIEPMKSTPERPTPFDHTTVAGRELIRSYLDRVTARGEFVDIFFHRIPAEEAEAFAELVRILAEYKDRVRPYHELFDEE
jgi:hypothetical protein